MPTPQVLGFLRQSREPVSSATESRDPDDRARRRDVTRAQVEALASQTAHLQVLAGVVERLTEVAEYFGGLEVNHTLYSGTVVLDALGVAELPRFRTPYASVRVDAGSASSVVTLSNAERGDRAPAAGVGTHTIGAGGAETIPLTGHVVTLYGRAGDAVSVVVRTRDTPPSSGMTSVPRSGAAAPVRVLASVAVQTLAAGNANRTGALIYNEAANGPLFVKFGAGASSADYTVQVAPGATFVLPGPAVYAGLLSGVWTGAVAGAAQITEQL